ncbi:uncharacterized protein LOC141907094 [Tubulanus polymorphus]|uniref:uncharacterized protein LOC141907094 n=1 Tax=Tubulanus polymorphus TaxID=672921 RepID=UPI003DA65176
MGINGRRVSTFALLDSASEISIINSDLAWELGLKGKPQTLTMNTLNYSSTVQSEIVSLSIRGIEVDAKPVRISRAWTRSDAFKCPAQPASINQMGHLRDLNIPCVFSDQIKILIGADVPKVHLQLEIREGDNDFEPIGINTPLGWCVMGPSIADPATYSVSVNSCTSSISSDDLLHQQVEQFWTVESMKSEKPVLSSDDSKALQILEETCCLIDSHYQVGMLWKDRNSSMPDNRFLALKRFRNLERRLLADSKLCFDYSKTLNGYIEKGFARKINDGECESCGRIWYLPHHAVRNQNKPGKTRVIFDAAATYRGVLLNNQLLTGPDLLNNMVGVLQRFRFGPIALVADVGAMYHQVRVTESDTDALRFLWKEDMTQGGDPSEYKMLVHIFGAADSACVANYCLKRSAIDNCALYSSVSVDAILNDFFMDDLLRALFSLDTSINLARDVVQILAKGGFHLTKFVSNSRELLSYFPKQELARPNLDLDLDELPLERALGLKWNVQSDEFVFTPVKKDVKPSKRGVLSAVSSVFDPCGFLAPFTFRAKCLMQDIWRSKVAWDDDVDGKHLDVWEGWQDELCQLRALRIPRHHLELSANVTEFELHIFCDASELGFGCVAYLRFMMSAGSWVNSFLAAKTRLASIKPFLTIPKLELEGAVLAVQLKDLR